MMNKFTKMELAEEHPRKTRFVGGDHELQFRSGL